MKLKNYNLTLQEKLDEFDVWVTPSLGDICEAESFQGFCDEIREGFQILSVLTDNFKTLKSCEAKELAAKLFEYLKDYSEEDRLHTLESVGNVLFMCTGKTDNNIKCQYPISLRNDLSYIFDDPETKSAKITIRRVYQLNDVAKLFCRIKKDSYKKEILNSYFSTILSNESYEKQVYSIGNAYCLQKEKNLDDSFINVLTIFQCRGSITAVQGHVPENKLRKCFVDWGMVSDIDFNSDDVDFDELIGLNKQSTQKKRKFDFIIPYKTDSNVSKKIFIQSQFYAGDSGSVSHKVVDQTDSSRNDVKGKFADPIFMEYLDGAGYYASLNGDLKKMLSKSSTKDFFQIRTAPIKLRREFQFIGFLTLLEVEHAALMTDGEVNNIKSHLQKDGYSSEEIERVINFSLQQEKIRIINNKVVIIPERIEIVRRYFLIDIIANFGENQTQTHDKGCLTVAGFQSHWGLPQVEVIKTALKCIPGLNILWTDNLQPFQDIDWLLQNGYVRLQ